MLVGVMYAHATSLARILGVTCLIAGSVTPQTKIHPDEYRLKPKIDAAIENGVESLLQTQQRDGTWGRYGRYDGGKTALCAYALLKSGVPFGHPAVRRAILYLDGVRPTETYTVACMMLAYSATGKKEHLARVKTLSKHLLRWQLNGDFGYPGEAGGATGTSRPDLSNTQYAALGLWIAQKHKIKIPSKVWRTLIDATLDYQSKPEKIKTLSKGEHTVAKGEREINGFGYVRGRKPTGSMTTAGVAILQICKIGLGSNFRKGRRRVEDAIEKGVAWLGHHFSVRQNPGARGSWIYYYLYGLERVGSLTRIEQMGEHWWYVRGARHLIRDQKPGGNWGRGAQREVDTAFALLFLRRATSGAASTGRNAISSGKKHLFTAGDRHDAAMIGGAGQQPLSLWVKGFGDDVVDRHEEHGIRVVQVEYLLGRGVEGGRISGGRVLGQVIGDPTKAWKTDGFVYRLENLRRGKHRIRARITVVRPEIDPPSADRTEIVHTPWMSVEIRDVFVKWMEVAAKMATPSNILRTAKTKVTATSNPKTAGLVSDGDDSTYWVCSADDERPEITIEFENPVFGKKIALTQAGARGVDRGLYDHILSVEVFVNRRTKGVMVNLDDDQLAVTSFELPRREKIRKLRIRIATQLPGKRAFQAGFSEIALLK